MRKCFKNTQISRLMPLKNGYVYFAKATAPPFWELCDKWPVTESGFNPVVWIIAVKNSSLLTCSEPGCGNISNSPLQKTY